MVSLRDLTRRLAGSAVLTLAAFQTGAVASDAPRFVYSPYKHLAIWNDPADNLIRTAPDGVPTPYLVDGASRSALTWAFASGECGDEVWGGVAGQAVADANVAGFERAGVGYLISTGGQGNVFTCASDAGMERFISRYDSSRLIGIDFDIEAGQSAQQIEALVARAVAAQARRPQLRFSFTVPTHAASDGSARSLNAIGETVLAAVRASSLRGYTFNLMVMDYGPASRAVCVLRRGRCDMGRSALQAARNVQARYGLPLRQIELTAMIGVNDVVENVFTVADARYLAAGVRRLKLAGLHFWSLDRDTPCRTPVAGADASCSTLAQVRSGAFARALEQARP